MLIFDTAMNSYRHVFRNVRIRKDEGREAPAVGIDGASKLRIWKEAPMDSARTLDRRTRYTIGVIREAFFELLEEAGFAKITVADICRRADINRGTFYLHFEDKYALLDSLIDDALATAPPLEGNAQASLCQRAPLNDEYLLLYSDSEVFARIAARVIEQGAKQVVPSIIEETGLPEQDAYLIFVHNAYGNLAVNRLLGWRRGADFDRAQALLNAYTRGGIEALAAEEGSKRPR